MASRFTWLSLIFGLALVGAGVLTGGASQTQAQESAPDAHLLADNLAIWPATQDVSVGASFSLEVRVTGSNPVTGADIYITFDPSKVDVTSVTNSGVLDTVIRDQSNLAGGRIQIGIGDLNGTPPTPPFTLLRIQGRAKSTLGTVNFNFNPAETDIQGTSGSVKGTLTDGVIVIKLAPTPTITLTPSRTPTPTITPTITPTPTTRPGQLCVLAFHDRNSNQRRDSGEELLAGAKIIVTDSKFVEVASRTTDGINDPACFTLTPDTYDVQETDPPGYISPAGNKWKVLLSSQARVQVDFADQLNPATNTPTATATPTHTATPIAPTPTHTATRTTTPTATHTPQPGQLCVLACDDRNGNGRCEAGEELLAGARIVVTDSNDKPVADYTTDGASEPKCFTLPPDIYDVQETDPPGYVSTGVIGYRVQLFPQGYIEVGFADQLDPDIPTATVTPQPRHLFYLPMVLSASR